MDKFFNELRKWVNIPEEEDYPPEYLMKTCPDSMYDIDTCPFTVNSNEKYGQFEMDYQWVLQGYLKKKSFLEVEKKYRNVITQLWLYNKTTVEFNSDWLWIRRRGRIIDKEYRKALKILVRKLKSTNILEVADRTELELIVQLGIRGVIATAYYFEDYKVFIIPGFSGFITYFNDLTKKDIVKDIVMTEGLYLR